MVFFEILPYAGIYALVYYILGIRLVFGKRSKRTSYSILFAVILLCCFSGFRSVTIGTDTVHYLNSFTSSSLYNDFGTYYNSVFNGRDYLFAGVTYLLAKLTNNNQFIYLFVCQLLVIAPIVFAVGKMKEYAKITYSFLFFLVLYYPIGLNTIREAIAGSFLFLALILYYRKEYSKAFFYALAAELFHHATILGLLVFVIVESIIRVKNKHIRCLIILMTITVIVLCAINSSVVFGYLFSEQLGFGNTKLALWYTRYNTGTLKTYLITMDAYGIREMAFRVIFFVMSFINGLQIDKHEQNAELSSYTLRFRIYSIISLIVYIVFFVSLSSTYGYRVTYYLDILNILYYAYILKNSRNNMRIAFVMLLVVYFYLIYVQLGAHGIFPYRVG